MKQTAYVLGGSAAVCFVIGMPMALAAPADEKNVVWTGACFVIAGSLELSLLGITWCVKQCCSMMSGGSTYGGSYQEQMNAGFRNISYTQYSTQRGNQLYARFG